MSDQPCGRGRARGRAGRGQQAGPAPRRPGEAAPGPRPQPPSAWGPPPVAPPVRAGVPAPAAQAGRASHRTTPSTHDHPGDVDIQQRMQKIDLGAQGPAAGGGDATGASGRGSRRGGGRVLPEQITVLRTRPAIRDSKMGKSGVQLDLIANYFTVQTTPQWRLYQYHVDVDPEEDSTGVRKALLRVHSNSIGGYIFDGCVLYTVKKLQDPLELYSDRKTDGQRMRLLIKLTCDVSPGDYHYIQIFNLIIRKCFRLLQLQLVGRDFFDPDAKVDIPEFKLQIWPGYKTTINQYEDRLLMVTEIAHKVLRMDTVLQMLQEYAATKGANFKKIFLEDVVGKIVMTDYNKRTYRVDDVTWTESPQSTFQMKDETISYMDYYYKKYNIRIHDKQQPLLISRSKPREIRAGMPELVYLIPELCRQTGLSDAMRANFQLMRAMDQHTKIGPEQRIQKLLAFNRRFTQNKEVVAEMGTWSMKLATDLVRIKGRQLPPETIVQGDKHMYPAGDTTEGWTRDMRGAPVFIGYYFQKYNIRIHDKQQPLLISRSKPREIRAGMPELVYLIPELCRQTGLSDAMRANFQLMRAMDQHTKIGPEQRIQKLLAFNRRFTQNKEVVAEMGTWSMKLATDLVRIKGRQLPPVTIVQGDKHVYPAGDTTEGWTRDMRSRPLWSVAPCPSWVVITPERQRRDAESFVELIIKTGGGAGFRLPRPEIVSIQRDGAMEYANMCEQVIAKKNPALILCALARNFADRYEAIKKKCTVDRAVPTQCVVARNMTSKSAMSIATKVAIQINCKVAEIKSKLKEVYGGAEFKMCFIIVSKRINTRIFVNGGRGGENPKPGTIIDDVVTLPERYDFFLVSQNVREGTIAPTSYNVIEDTSGLAPDVIQGLTYKLTHMYFNNSSAVRVPSVCQYAHKLAFLAANSLHSQPHYSLNETLYFL